MLSRPRVAFRSSASRFPWTITRRKGRLLLVVGSIITLLIWYIQRLPTITTRLDARRYGSLAAGKIEAPTSLWSYTEGNKDGWVWANTQRREGYRRPSWGALSQQGPKASIRTNLKEGMQYLTAFHYAGWNNQVEGMCNNILVALWSNRIPLLSPFRPYGEGQSYLTVTEVFDFTELVDKYKVPIVDMFELKVPQADYPPHWVAERHQTVVYDGEFPHRAENGSELAIGDTIQAEAPEQDLLQCWGAHLSSDLHGPGYLFPHMPTTMEWTPLPPSVFHDNPIHPYLSTHGLADAIASYSKPGDKLPEYSVERLEELGLPPSQMKPDEQLNCVDHIFAMYVDEDSGHAADWADGVGAWEAVGQYVRFQPGLVRLAEDLLRELMGLDWNAPVPPYLGIHIRRDDMPGTYRHMGPEVWAYFAWMQLHEIKEVEGVRLKHIVFTTDETDQAWLDGLRKLGWIYVDHDQVKTTERLDLRMPTIIDSIILSHAHGFLGTPVSTMSILCYQRVKVWGGGIARFLPGHTDPPEGWEWKRDW